MRPMVELQEERGDAAATSAPAPPPLSPPPPSPPGWTGAAMAVHAVRRMPTPMVVSLQPDGLEPMLIDMRGYVYQWSEPLDSFPAAPATVLIGTRAIREAEPAFAGDDFVEHPPAFAGAPLEPLLWLIGTHAFDGARASWLRSGDRYRLYRWPDFGLLPMSDDQRRIVKASASGFMVVEKLAQRAKVEIVEAQRVVNALSLMGLLRRHAAADAAPDAPPPPPAGGIPGA
mgnify:CR=1 FL=1